MAIVLHHPPRLSASRRSTVHRWWRERIECWERLAEEEQRLRDAGLMRDDARFLARKPFWLA